MPTADTAPHGGEPTQPQPEPIVPEPKPGEQSDEPVRGQPNANSESRRDGGAAATDADVDPVTGTGQDIAG
jgi:hypothetical protein